MSNILTEKIKIKYISDPIFIKNKVKNYSYAFRLCYKEIKQEYYPKFDTGTILNTMQSLNSDGDVSFIKDCETWIMCYKHIKSLNGENHKFRWRRSLKDVKNGFNELSVITRKTRVKKQEFHNKSIKFI